MLALRKGWLVLLLTFCTLLLSGAPALAYEGHGDHGDHGGSDSEWTEEDDQKANLVALLTGGAEVNAEGVPGQGDPDGSGIARVRINSERGRACINAHVRNVDPLVLAHIHNAPAGRNGPIVVDFTALIAGDMVKGCVEADPAVLKAIAANPANYYINIHSEAFRAGAVRGQLEPRGSLRTTLRVELSGANEVGNPGDPDGSGVARVTIKAREGEVCINASVRKLAALTLAHIHNAPAGSNGPIVVDFTQFIDGRRVRGCVTVEPNLLQALRSAPADYYVNIHTVEFPAGAVRGQLQ